MPTLGTPKDMTESEKDILDSIETVTGRLRSKELLANSERMAILFERLCERQAIPRERWSYLSEPICNTGGRGKSRQQQLGLTGDNLVHWARNPVHLDGALYMVCGANLPESMKAAFFRKVTELAGSEGAANVTSGDFSPLATEATCLGRVLIRDGWRKKRVMDELFKLFIDCGLYPNHSKQIYDMTSKKLRF